MKRATPSPKFRIGDRVRVSAVGPIREFVGEIVRGSYNTVGGGNFYVRDEDGNEWLRHPDEMRLVGETVK